MICVRVSISYVFMEEPSYARMRAGRGLATAGAYLRDGLMEALVVLAAKRLPLGAEILDWAASAHPA